MILALIGAGLGIPIGNIIYLLTRIGKREHGIEDLEWTMTVNVLGITLLLMGLFL